MKKICRKRLVQFVLTIIIVIVLMPVNLVNAAQIVTSKNIANKSVADDGLAGNVQVFAMDSSSKANSSILIKDSKGKFISLKNQKQVKVGSVVYFGAFEQDNNLKNGPERIEWYILEKNGNKLKIVSKNSLIYKNYQNDSEYLEDLPDWNSCKVRNWMNNEFYSSAFNEMEKQHIATTKQIEYGKYTDKKYSGYYGYVSDDKVFLLSEQEFLKYNKLLGEKLSRPSATKYAIRSLGKNATKDDIAIAKNRILLRSKHNPYRADCVWFGEIDNADNGFICPAMWVTLSADSNAKVADYTDEKVFKTTVDSGCITIKGVNNKNITSLKIPHTIGNKKVIAIAGNAFVECKKLTTIIIPEGITTIAADAFQGCSSLTEIAIPSSLTDMDSSTITSCKKLEHIYLPDKLNPSLTWLRRYESEEMAKILKTIDTDKSRWGMWNLTYKEFIEIYRSIGTDNDLFLKMLKEKGARHTDPTIWLNYDGLPGVEIRFDDILTEKIYALHYAPFEYNSEDLLSGNMGKDTAEAYLDHGGVCSILAHTYGHFVYNILGETNWEYAYYGNEKVNHEVLVIRTENGKCFQVDNCGVDYWWLGIETIPDMQKIGSYTPDNEWSEAFNTQKNYLNTSKDLHWSDFCVSAHYDFDKESWENRPIWYDYNLKDWNAYLGYSIPMYYVCNYIGLEKIISMAGYTKLDGYIDIDELEFSKPKK